MRTNIFGISDPFTDLRTLMGQTHPMFLIEDNKKKLEAPLKIETIKIKKRLKTPVKGFKFSEAVGIGNGYSGEITDKRLYYGRQELPLLCLENDNDKFKAVFSAQEQFGEIILIQQGAKSLSKLKQNIRSLHKVVFNEMGVMVAVARGAPPINDIGTWGDDKREEKVLWSDKNQIWIPRLCLFWCHVIENMIPEILIDDNSPHDHLLWLGSEESRTELPEEMLEEINEQMNERIKWKL